MESKAILLQMTREQLEKSPNLMRLTQENANQFISHDIIFQTRNQNVIRTIKGASKSGRSVYIDHKDLNNNIGIKRAVFVIKGSSLN